MADDPRAGDDVLSGLPRTRPQRSNPKREAARAKAAKPAATAAAKPARKAAAKPAGKAKPKVAPRPEAAARPKAAPPAAKPTPARGYATPKPAPKPQEGVQDLASTAVQAAGELIGLGGRVLKGVLDRLPRP